MYVENLCSDTSRTLVEEHLEHCKECRILCSQLQKEYEPVPPEMAKRPFIEEKKLFEKSRQGIKESFIRTAAGKLFTGVFISRKWD